MNQQLPPEVIHLNMVLDYIEKSLLGAKEPAIQADPKADLVTVTTYRNRKTKQLTTKDDPQGYVLDLLVECHDGPELTFGEAFVAHDGTSYGFKKGEVLPLWDVEKEQAKRKWLAGEITVYGGEPRKPIK